MSETSSPVGQLVEGREAEADQNTKGGADVQPAVTYFSAESFRPGQREAIEKIDEAFAQGYRFVILEAPTGIGKSHIAMSFARQSSSCHILTVQKILQDQYQRDFQEAFVMKGRNAYECKLGGNCSDGLCRRSKKLKHSDCPYREALAAAGVAKIVVHNFDSFYYQHHFAHQFSERDLMIVDEAHNIENKYLNFISFTISNYKNRSLEIPNFNTIAEYDEFLRLQYEEVCNRLAVLQEFEEIGLDELKEKDELVQLKAKLDRYILMRERGENIEYVFDYVDHNVYQSVTFRPVFVGDFAKSSLFSMGERVLMMSATILSKQIFCESVGLDPDEVAFIEVASYFPTKNRPIVKSYVGEMTFKHINDTLPKVVVALREILDRHPNRKGIIQTHSEKIATYIQQHLFDTRLTFRRDYRTVLEMLQVHESKEGSFIVASGLKEGLDLYDDLSRVQVFAKVPYPDLGDKRVKRRKELNSSWYGYMTVLMFVQAYGRSIRSGSDKAITYLLDESFDNFFKWNRKFIPKYVREALRK